MADSLVIDTGRSDAFWVSYVKNRIKNKKNFLGILTGPTGSGKSWSALSFCYQVDPTFIPKRIIFSMESLMKLINEGDLKSGQAILWDESGIDVGNRSWQSVTNKLINFLLQTFRHKRLVLIMTCPYLDFIDSNTRKLFHAELLTQKIDYKKKTCRTKAQLLQYNPRNKKFYYKYLRIRTKRGVAPLKAWNITQPPTWLIDEYEVLKSQFTNKLNINIQEQLQRQKAKEEQGDRKPLTHKQKQTMVLMAKHGDADLVADELGCSQRNVYQSLRFSKEKGYNLEEFDGE